MKLAKVKLRNFRCYRDETSIHLGDLSCFIGRNDAGKSSVIEALDIFFNGTVDKGDLSTDNTDETIEITCFFDGLPKKLVLDNSIDTSLEGECLLNKGGYLEIKKVYKLSRNISKEIYIRANHPNADKIKNILSLKNTTLKNLAKELQVNLEGVNKTKNPLLRAAIRDHINSDLEEMDIRVEGKIDGEDNLKTIWPKINQKLPIYSIFKVDKALDDKDKDVQDPMKVAIKEALAIDDIKEMLDAITDKIKDETTKVASLTLEKLKDFDEALSETMRAEFGKQPGWDKIFDLTLLNDRDIPLNKRGSGIRRLVLLSFFRAQAEEKRRDSGSHTIIYAIEEPETSQHPDHQKMVIEALVSLSESQNVQAFFTTHSANLVREIPIESLIYVTDGEDKEKISYGRDLASGENNDETLNQIIDTLGVLPDPRDTIKCLLYVEGNNDAEALKRYSNILANSGKIAIDLNNYEGIGIVLVGGSSLKHYVERKYLAGLGKPEFHIYDNDREDYRKYVNDINEEGNDSKKAFNTRKSELENYLSARAIQEAYRVNGRDIIMPEINDADDVPIVVAEVLYRASGNNWDDLTDDEKSKRGSGVKRFLNSQAVEKMSVDCLLHRNGLEEMVMWFDEMASLCGIQRDLAA